MKSNKKKASFITALVTMTALMSGSILSANATTYTNGWYRGARYISYVETDFTWTVNNRYLITSSSATQWSEGFFTEEGGTSKTYDDQIETHYNCKAKVKIGIGKLSYNKTYSDNVCLSNSGDAWCLD